MTRSQRANELRGIATQLLDLSCRIADEDIEREEHYDAALGLVREGLGRDEKNFHLGWKKATEQIRRDQIGYIIQMRGLAQWMILGGSRAGDEVSQIADELERTTRDA